jgi:hypothetical protein
VLSGGQAALLLFVEVYFVMPITRRHAVDFAKKPEVGSRRLAENIGVFDMCKASQPVGDDSRSNPIGCSCNASLEQMGRAAGSAARDDSSGGKKRLQPGGSWSRRLKKCREGGVRHSLDMGDGWTIPTYIMV